MTDYIVVTISSYKISKLIQNFKIQKMRRSPYSSQSQYTPQPQLVKPKQSNNFLFNPVSKQELSKLYTGVASYLPSPSPVSNQKLNNNYHLYQRNSRPMGSVKRPLTVNRTHSQLKNKNQDRDKQYIALDINLNHNNHNYQSSNNKQLWVSGARDSRGNSTPRQQDQSKGKVYRGSSFKLDDKSKIHLKQYREASRYSHTSRLANNLTPTSKQQRNSFRQSYRTNGIYDLINKNLKQKVQQPKSNKKSDEFFQYVMRFSYRTKKGSVPSNPNKVNQDSYIISPNIQNKTYQHFFGICDGHGPLGHLVSGYVKNTLPSSVLASKNLQKSPIESLMKAFEISYQKLIKQSQVDLTFSGSTVITVYMFQDKLYCCNVGDSRAIIGQYNNNKKWSALQLSQDHKPNLPKQAERIKKMNGRIQAYKDQNGEQIGPLRVWAKSQNVPGLAMTRSFGDLIGASVGVSPVPQIKQFGLSEQDRIILIASDGVFQFLENIKIIDQLAPFYQNKQIQQASDHLLNLAHRSWNQNSSIVDDITFILIFLNYNQI